MKRVLSGRRFSLFLLILLVLGAVALVIATNVTNLPPVVHRQGPYVGLALALGVVVAASELVSRYRDEPSQALISSPGVFYCLMNGVVSALTYGILVRYAKSIFPGLAKDRLMLSIAAGLGAMAILRSKFFTLRSQKGEDIPVGPDAAVQAFLNAADRSVDRVRAERRLKMVAEWAQQIKPPEAGNDFLRVSIAAFQNLSDDDKSEFLAVFDEVVKTKYSPELQLQMIAYGLLGLSGERMFKEFMTALKDYGARIKPATGS